MDPQELFLVGFFSNVLFVCCCFFFVVVAFVFVFLTICY